MIGEIIQLLLDRGFCIEYHYDDGVAGMRNAHYFLIKKYYKDDPCSASFGISDAEVKHAVCKEAILLHAKQHMKLVDDVITQRRLIEEVLHETA